MRDTCMLLKDEADGQKKLPLLRSARVSLSSGAWTVAHSAPPHRSDAAEGPSLLERNGELYTYFDKYGDGAYGACRRMRPIP